MRAPSAMRDLRSVPAMRPPGSPRCGVPGRLEYRRAAGERPPRARPQRRGSPGPIPNPAVKPAFAESTAAQGCGRAGRRARGGRFSFRARGLARRMRRERPAGGIPLAGLHASWGMSRSRASGPRPLSVAGGRLGRSAGVWHIRGMRPGAPQGEGPRGALWAFPHLRERSSPCGNPCVPRFARGAGGPAARLSVWALSRFGEAPICERELFGILQGVLDFERLRL